MYQVFFSSGRIENLLIITFKEVTRSNKQNFHRVCFALVVKLLLRGCSAITEFLSLAPQLSFVSVFHECYTMYRTSIPYQSTSSSCSAIHSVWRISNNLQTVQSVLPTTDQNGSECTKATVFNSYFLRNFFLKGWNEVFFTK